MASESILIDTALSTVPRCLNEPAALRSGVASRVTDFLALTKPEVNSLIVIATFTGFCMAYASQAGAFPFSLLVHTLVGTLLVASGAATLNQYLERDFDALMRRTGRRPLAAGRLQPSLVLWFGIVLSTVGSIYLAIAVNVIASLLATATALSYLFVYTPLKRKTPFCTLIGALPGAAPPLIGWAAASGRLSREAWILFAILFLWQFPHFMAIAWMHRDDYDRAGYFVLPQGKARASFVALQTILPLVALFPVPLLVASFAQPGIVYSIGSLLLNSGFLYYGLHFLLRRSRSAARRLLLASVIYLPSLFVLMVAFRDSRTNDSAEISGGETLHSTQQMRRGANGHHRAFPAHKLLNPTLTCMKTRTVIGLARKRAEMRSSRSSRNCIGASVDIDSTPKRNLPAGLELL